MRVSSLNTKGISMRIFLICFVCALLCIPLFSSGEKLYLLDGSILNGTIETLDADSVYITTTFGNRLVLARKTISRIEFHDLPSSGSGISNLVQTDPGSLLVLFDSQELSSKIIVHRDKDIALSLTANTIEQILYIDNEIVFAYEDTLPDKKIRKGADTIYKNTIELKDIRISLPAGPHTMKLIIGNKGRIKQKERFDNDPLLKTFERSNLIIYPGKTTRLVIEAKKKKWGMGGMELRIRE